MLDTRIVAIDRKLVEICRKDERCKRLATLPGVGPVVATALIIAVDDGRHSTSGRHWRPGLGLTHGNTRPVESPGLSEKGNEETNICAASSYTALDPFYSGLPNTVISAPNGLKPCSRALATIRRLWRWQTKQRVLRRRCCAMEKTTKRHSARPKPLPRFGRMRMRGEISMV